MTTPIKRHHSLQPLSRDHHDALLLVWKIRKGISLNVDASRIQKYVDRFITEHLIPHFKIEEEHLFVLAEKDSAAVKQALAEHADLILLFNSEIKNYDLLNKIADLLEAHIRFEERVLFNEIQSVAGDAELKALEALHASHPFCDTEEEVFWK